MEIDIFLHFYKGDQEGTLEYTDWLLEPWVLKYILLSMTCIVWGQPLNSGVVKIAVIPLICTSYTAHAMIAHSFKL